MLKKIVVAILAVMLMSSVSMATDAEKVKMPETLKAGSSDLLLNGKGIRKKAWLKLYVGGLYLKAKNSDGASVVSADEPMAIKLHITSKMITGEKMAKATNEGFENSTNGNTAPIKAEIEKMIAVFSEGISVDDVYDMVYVPGEGTTIFKSGKKMATVSGLAFKQALFGIWVGSKPAQEELKAGMLGS